MNTRVEEPNSHLATAIDRFILRIGKLTSWLYAVLVLVIMLQVVMRYGFNLGKTYLEELQWHIYAVAS